jgi:hypothetical protein
VPGRETDCTREELRATGTAIPPLPVGTCLLHIGPYKTGTTVVQGALFAAKEETARHGVGFPAHSRHPVEAVLAACARPAMAGTPSPPSGTGSGCWTGCGPPGGAPP